MTTTTDTSKTAFSFYRDNWVILNLMDAGPGAHFALYWTSADISDQFPIDEYTS